MGNRINYYWRIFATGLSFFLFGIGGIILRLIIFPFFNIVIWKKSIRTSMARRTVKMIFRAFIEIMNFLGVLSYQLSGLERLNRHGLLILANHPTLIDTVFLMAFIKDADCIVKSTLWQNPFTRGPVMAANYIRNSDGPGLIEDCFHTLHQGNNLIIFPEGTRTPRNGLMVFQRGAANIATRYAHNITPVVIKCDPLTLGKGEKWWKVPPSIARFSIEIREDIAVQPFLTDALTLPLAARKLTTYLKHYFMEACKHNANT